MSSKFEPIFARLRGILQKHSGALTVTQDSSVRYCLSGNAGAAALRAWGGKMKRPMIPVAWVQIGKAYVSYHLMGVYGCPALLDGCSKELRARMQGKSCFNFKTDDERLFKELEPLTRRAITGFAKTGFITKNKDA